jgi:hypothetical protein
MFNRGTSAAEMSLMLSEVGIASGSKITDLWSGKKVVAKDGQITTRVPFHGVVLLRIEP